MDNKSDLGDLTLIAFHELAKFGKKAATIILTPVVNLTWGGVDGALIPYSIPTTVRKHREFTSEYGHEFPYLENRGVAYALGRTVGLSASATGIWLGYGLLGAYNDKPELWLIPLATNTLSGIYETFKKARSFLNNQNTIPEEPSVTVTGVGNETENQEYLPTINPAKLLSPRE